MRNVPGLAGAETTWCPNCTKPVVERDIFAVTALNLANGKCRSCGTKIAGVWSQALTFHCSTVSESGGNE